MSLAEKYYLSKDDIVIKEEKEGSSYYFLFPVLPEFLPSEIIVNGGFDGSDYNFETDFVCFDLNMFDDFDEDIIFYFFDNGFLKNLYFGNDFCVEVSSYNFSNRLYTNNNFDMSKEKFNLFFRNIQYFEKGSIAIGDGLVFETKNVSDYKTACLLRDYLCQLHNKAVDLIFESYLSQDVL